MKCSIRLLVGSILLSSLSSISLAADKTGETLLLAKAKAEFAPLPKSMASKENPLTPAKVRLGRLLFFDPRFSLDGTVSCMRCHQAGLYATDGLAKAIGVKDRANPRNSPTVLNAALQISAHWRGDRESVEDQAAKALTGPGSFGNPDPQSAVAKIKAIDGYTKLFSDAFPGDEDPITVKNFGLAVGAYERTLVTPAPFDLFLRGKKSALNDRAQQGLKTFMEVGCVSCHNGAGVGGNRYQKFGVVEEYWKATGSKEPDHGRFDVTKKPEDEFVFKVPSLRNVTHTAPYFHDGSVGNLNDAVKVMARVQLGKTLSEDQTQAIVAFLDSLTGEVPESLRSAPVLPGGSGAGKVEAPVVAPEKAPKTTSEQK